MRKIIAAYDFGTSGVKIVLLGLDGKTYALAEEKYPLIRPAEGWVEQDPADSWNAVRSVTKKAVSAYEGDVEDIIAVNFSVQIVTLIPVSSQGEVLYNAVSWLDGRAVKQAQTINQRLGFEAVCPQDYQCRLLWFKEEKPEIYEKAAWFLGCDGFLQYKFTGIMAVDPNSEAIKKPNPDRAAYVSMIEKAAGVEGKIPPAVAPTKIYGYVDKRGAADLGIPEGIPVFGAGNDVIAAAAGAGCFKEGDSHIYLGSSGWLSAIVRDIKESAIGSYHIQSMDPDMMIYGGCINTCCSALNWLIDNLYHCEKEQMGEYFWDYLNKEIETVPSGCDGLMMTPWLHGEQFPVHSQALRGTFLNMNSMHTRAHMVAAFMESICYSIKWQIEIFERDHGIKIKQTVANGGGSQSDAWMQRMADILGIPVCIPKNSAHSGAIGIAVAAAIGMGICNFDDAGKMVKQKKIFYPSAKKETYETGYKNYQSLYDALLPVYERLNGK